jgi:hypothetical protein
MVSFCLLRTLPRLRVSSEPGQCSRSERSRAHSQDAPSRKSVLLQLVSVFVSHGVLTSIRKFDDTRTSSWCKAKQIRFHLIDESVIRSKSIG